MTSADHETPPWRIAPGGVLVSVRATPRASRSGIAGVGHDTDGRPVLLVRIAAPPADGAANAALLDMLAAALGVRGRDVTLHSGGTGRNKQVHVRGESDGLTTRLTRLLASLRQGS